jgi:hypothetical protein
LPYHEQVLYQSARSRSKASSQGLDNETCGLLGFDESHGVGLYLNLKNRTINVCSVRVLGVIELGSVKYHGFRPDTFKRAVNCFAPCNFCCLGLSAPVVSGSRLFQLTLRTLSGQLVYVHLTLGYAFPTI